MSNLSLREIAQSQLDSTPVIDGQVIVCLDTGNTYRDSDVAHVKIGSDLEVVSELPLAPLANKFYFVKPNSLYIYDAGNWIKINTSSVTWENVLDKPSTYPPTSHDHDLNAMINKLSTDSDTPNDADYYVCQYVGGGTTTTTYHRRPMSALWTYIKSKTDSLYQKKSNDFSDVITITKSIKLTTDWQDTGITGTNLTTGTYIVQVSGFNSTYTQLYGEIYSGVMSWYASQTNSSNSSEIFLHNAGHADNNNAIYLRTIRSANPGYLKLQIACKITATDTDSLTFKFRRLI